MGDQTIQNMAIKSACITVQYSVYVFKAHQSLADCISMTPRKHLETAVTAQCVCSVPIYFLPDRVSLRLMQNIT